MQYAEAYTVCIPLQGGDTSERVVVVHRRAVHRTKLVGVCALQVSALTKCPVTWPRACWLGSDSQACGTGLRAIRLLEVPRAFSPCFRPLLGSPSSSPRACVRRALSRPKEAMEGSDDIFVHKFSISMGGKTLFKDAKLSLAHGRRYGLIGAPAARPARTAAGN